MRGAIETLEGGGGAAGLGAVAATIVVLALANGIARLGSRLALIGAAQGIEADLRGELFLALSRRPPRFFERHPVGELMARATSDLAAVRSLVGFGAMSLGTTILGFAGGIAAMVTVDAWLTLWALAPYPALVALARGFNGRIHRRTQATQAAVGRLSDVVQETLGASAVVRAYTLEARAREHFAAADGELFGASLALARAQAWFGPLVGLVGAAGPLIALWRGGRAVLDGDLSLGALVAFTGYLAYLAWPTLALGLTLGLVRRGLTSMARLGEVLETGAGPDGPPGILPPADDGAAGAPGVGGPFAPEQHVARGSPRPWARTTSTARAGAAGAQPGLRLERVSFAYPGRPAVLTDVSLAVARGELVVVTGPTGSGKTTLALLAARLWEPPRGTIFLDGLDVTAIEPERYRAEVGWMPQEAFLFSRAIAENVALGRAEIGTDAVREALDAAAVREEIERLPEGLASVIGERGLTLSGGQRQRVTLARAVAPRPRVLVLDDPFAHVDAATESALLATLERVRGEQAILLITHRLRAALAADRVVVLEAGRVVEAGTHQELLAHGGAYARLWRRAELRSALAGG